MAETEKSSRQVQITIPLSFELAAEQPFDIGSGARRRLRDRFHGGALLDRCVRDIRHLLLPDEKDLPVEDDLGENVVRLWDGSRRTVAAGSNYSEGPF